MGKQKRILYVLSKKDLLYTEKISQEALRLARGGNIVWILLKDRGEMSFNKHSNIYIYNLGKRFFNLASFWRILKRKKKFDKIYVDDETYGKRLNNFKIFHKAEVVYAR